MKKDSTPKPKKKLTKFYISDFNVYIEAETMAEAIELAQKNSK